MKMLAFCLRLVCWALLLLHTVMLFNFFCVGLDRAAAGTASRFRSRHIMPSYVELVRLHTLVGT
jgi:hypothetical protein